MNLSLDNDPEETILSEDTRALLQQAGWYPGRDINIDGYVQALLAEGYPVFPVVKKFLKKFGGIEIKFTFDTVYGTIASSVHFDAAAAAAAVYNEGYVSKYVERTGTPLCVIGESENRNTTLMMDQEGKVYGGFDSDLAFFGETGEQAIENILNRQNIRRLP